MGVSGVEARERRHLRPVRRFSVYTIGDSVTDHGGKKMNVTVGTPIATGRVQCRATPLHTAGPISCQDEGGRGAQGTGDRSNNRPIRVILPFGGPVVPSASRQLSFGWVFLLAAGHPNITPFDRIRGSMIADVEKFVRDRHVVNRIPDPGLSVAVAKKDEDLTLSLLPK